MVLPPDATKRDRWAYWVTTDHRDGQWWCEYSWTLIWYIAYLIIAAGSTAPPFGVMLHSYGATNTASLVATGLFGGLFVIPALLFIAALYWSKSVTWTSSRAEAHELKWFAREILDGPEATREDGKTLWWGAVKHGQIGKRRSVYDQLLAEHRSILGHPHDEEDIAAVKSTIQGMQTLRKEIGR
jgi:hypothetical protein